MSERLHFLRGQPTLPDGSDLKTIINEARKLPDGLAFDVAAGHIY